MVPLCIVQACLHLFPLRECPGRSCPDLQRRSAVPPGSTEFIPNRPGIVDSIHRLCAISGAAKEVLSPRVKPEIPQTVHSPIHHQYVYKGT